MMTISSFNTKPENRFCYGFTLLEVLVALSFIAIVLVSALRLQGQSINMTETTRFYTIASFLAQKKMAEIRFEPQPFMGSESGNFDDSFSGFTWAVTLTPLEENNPENSVLPLLYATVTIQSDTIGVTYVLRDSFYTVTGDQL